MSTEALRLRHLFSEMASTTIFALASRSSSKFSVESISMAAAAASFKSADLIVCVLNRSGSSLRLCLIVFGDLRGDDSAELLLLLLRRPAGEFSLLLPLARSSFLMVRVLNLSTSSLRRCLELFGDSTLSPLRGVEFKGSLLLYPEVWSDKMESSRSGICGLKFRKRSISRSRSRRLAVDACPPILRLV